MILHLLLGTIAAATPAPAARPAPPAVLAGAPRGRLLCRIEFGTASLVQRTRICHTRADWQAIDLRRRARRRP